MKNLIFSISFLSFCIAGFGQYKELEKMYFTKRYENAKLEIDKLEANPATASNKETYSWKAKVYGMLYSNPQLSEKYPNAEFIAYEALKKLRGSDTSSAWVKDHLQVVDVLYSNTWRQGVESFNRQNYDSAFIYFKIAQDMGNSVSRAGLTTTPQPIDTIRTFYAGAAAQNLGKKEDAAGFYQMLADFKIGGKDYLDMYKYLLAIYLEAKDSRFKPVLELVKKLYPEQTKVWTDYEFQYISQNLTPEQIMESYRKDDAEGLMTAEQYVGYGQAMGNPGKEKEEKLDSTLLSEMKNLSAEAFKKAFAKSNNGIDAFNAAVIYYNQWATLDDRFRSNRGSTPTLKAKREAIEKEQFIAANHAIEWMTKAYERLKELPKRERVETLTLNRSIDFLANLYLWKRDKSRGNNPKDYDLYDARYKKFDLEHDKYK